MATLFSLYRRAEAEQAMVLKQLEPFRVKEEKLIEQLAVIEAKLREVRTAIVEIEEPRLRLAKLVIAARHNPKPSPESEKIYEAAMEAYEKLPEPATE